MIRFLDVRAIQEPIEQELIEAMSRVLRSGWFVLGPEVEAFEAEWAAYVGARHCVAVGNGLDAITLTMRAQGVRAGDEVLVPSHTFVATWLAVSACGAVPMPVEVDPATFNVTARSVSEALTERTRAVVPVHLYGQPFDADELTKAVGDVPVIQDAAQAHGARWAGRRVGQRGTACWSFYPGKNLGALGDAGAVTTDDSELAESLRLLRNYGSRRKYVHERAGVNSRLDELQAAALRVKLRYLDTWNAARADLAKAYTAALSGVVSTPAVPDAADPAWHLYVVRTTDRDGVSSRLAAREVETLVHYPTPPHRQAAFSHLGYDLPVADVLAREVLSLPMGPHVDRVAFERVVDAVHAAVERK